MVLGPGSDGPSNPDPSFTPSSVAASRIDRTIAILDSREANTLIMRMRA
jgi:hypothetical protein